MKLDVRARIVEDIVMVQFCSFQKVAFFRVFVRLEHCESLYTRH